MSNRVIHFEIFANDEERAKKFYSTVFGWTFQKWDFDGGVYWGVMTAPVGSNEPGINGGLLKRIGPKPADGQAVASFTCTIQVSNIDETIRNVEEAGGKLVVNKVAIPGMAWQAYCKDTEGNIFGIYEPNKEAK